MNALQVYFGDKLVGTLKGAVRDLKEVPAEIPIIEKTESIAKYGKDAGNMRDMVWVQTGLRSAVVEEAEIRRVADIAGIGLSDPSFKTPTLFAKYFGVPSYAERFNRSHDRSIGFEWRVLAPTLSQYEILFDMDEFEPL
ncbi:hypothetical protein PXK56_18120 [Phaeobacter gallaeciensis]|uniref:hypothetical protein n=1 Tax=Phaeobacter gallaeciensis TaxID=60890 RepID=UPI00237FDC4B|nr:hypothetical protein [Phaeobacter gallaeciensis]MDE4297107.1 hypothetical protein [Phaeobacter gallaeciensis]